MPMINIAGMQNLSRFAIKPGEYHATGDTVIISTLLGSCVSACLYDPLAKISGMNHFLLSNRRYARNMPYYVTEAGRYGIYAMELLINEMLRLGAKRDSLRAKIFGGSSLFQSPDDVGNFFCVGSANVRFIKEFIAYEGIPLVAEDLGGDRGRAIYFCTGDFSVHVRKIQRTINTRLGLREKRFWQERIESQENKASGPDISI